MNVSFVHAALDTAGSDMVAERAVEKDKGDFEPEI